MRVGIGYDVHRFGDGESVTLGGTQIACGKSLVGHSDADALTHAIMDALLGAAALGDIGRHFPDTDQKYKNIRSLSLLEKVGGLLRNEGYAVCNIDSVIIAETPKLAPFIQEMRSNIAQTLEISVECVSVKATTEEGLGLAGEGIGAKAVCLIEKV